MNERKLPLSMVTLVFGVLSVPLAFARQLCVPALVMALLAIAFFLAGRRLQRSASFTAASRRHSLLGFRLALAGSGCALLMWVLWATNVLL
ncbi:MAG: hypothetical protein KBH07_08180 [Flavobacteriales bacterium]|nr:hypothetical protein [Flavobacteriales bacterium]MBP9080525.1 hypothetical protein [Flavobacteriales bacterium]